MTITEAYNATEEKAKQVFNREDIRENQLVGSTHFDDHKVRKVFEVKETTVVVALPDMKMEEVAIDTLYSPMDAENIFLEEFLPKLKAED